MRLLKTSKLGKKKSIKSKLNGSKKPKRKNGAKKIKKKWSMNSKRKCKSRPLNIFSRSFKILKKVPSSSKLDSF